MIRTSAHPCTFNVASQDRSFGPWTVHGSEVFCESDLSYAFVNLKPVVPGHVLVSSKRVVPRFLDLSDEESTDLWCVKGGGSMNCS